MPIGSFYSAARRGGPSPLPPYGYSLNSLVNFAGSARLDRRKAPKLDSSSGTVFDPIQPVVIRRQTLVVVSVPAVDRWRQMLHLEESHQ